MTKHNFDFITDPRFRTSLESDTIEMNQAFDTRSWKSAQVLAGSIVEALLVDYIVATNSPPRKGKDPLKLDLAEAVVLCHGENVLSNRTVDLSSVIRSYRNLIHPGRVIRLAEQAPSEDSARIAISVVNLIIEEVARKRRSEFGLTAEQILSKIERDSGSLAILRHLAADANPQQLERLIAECIPRRFLELERAMEREDFFDDPDTLTRLRKAYRILFDGAPAEARGRSVAGFVRSLREDDGDAVLSYSRAFLKASDLAHVAANQRPILVQHLLARLSDGVSHEALEQVSGLARFLTDSDVNGWMDPLVKAFLSPASSKSLKDAMRRQILESAGSNSSSVDARIDLRLDAWVKAFNERGNTGDAALITSLKDELESERLPF